eukprot:TRINITY_DN80270_c0_g1_i1.p1 TRINITY_DN80270_c0_g1~~TRINITY_DN80270_c0_g1_i1.p1  ORF type:complete len:301 (-),score=65.52 TRINITY_DN80270_c0_g1_i1:205-1107(-)
MAKMCLQQVPADVTAIDLEALKAPPGLSLSQEVEPQSSAGSLMHGTGECKPCAWFWHPRACANGADCEYCHLCPEGELKLRRKIKIQGLRGSKTKAFDATLNSLQVAAPSLSPISQMASWSMVATPEYEISTASDEPGEQLDVTSNGSEASVPDMDNMVSGTEVVQSIGTAKHGTGECRPCAWFWKPAGCQNGKECLHCHLCPVGELKRKKKEKLRGFARDAAQTRQRMQGEPTRHIQSALTAQHQLIQQQQQQLVQMQLQLQMQQMHQMQQMQAHLMMASAACASPFLHQVTQPLMNKK